MFGVVAAITHFEEHLAGRLLQSQIDYWAHAGPLSSKTHQDVFVPEISSSLAWLVASADFVRFREFCRSSNPREEVSHSLCC